MTKPTGNNHCSIFLVDDEPAILKALRQSLEQNISCSVESFAEAHSCLKRLETAPCHLLVTDVNLPGMDGIEMLEEVKQRRPRLPILVITGYGDIPMAVRAVKSGALDFIEKPLDEPSFISAVETALEKHWGDEPYSAKPLTKAEIAILQFIAAGKSNKEIAYQLKRSIRTIENHRHRIMKKLDVENTVDLVKKAIQMGVTSL